MLRAVRNPASFYPQVFPVFLGYVRQAVEDLTDSLTSKGGPSRPMPSILEEDEKDEKMDDADQRGDVSSSLRSQKEIIIRYVEVFEFALFRFGFVLIVWVCTECLFVCIYLI